MNRPFLQKGGLAMALMLFVSSSALAAQLENVALATESSNRLEKDIHELKEKLEHLKHLDKEIFDHLRAVKSDLAYQKKIIHIHEDDLPFTTDKPGVYCLIGESVYKPMKPNTAAITITSPNVVLDLNGHTLSQGNIVAGTIGVLINGVSEVIIKNGKTESFTQNGIQVAPASSEVFIEGILATKNGVNVSPSAFVLNSTGGLFLKDASNIQVQSSNFDKNIGFGGGVTISGCTNVVIDHCSCNNNLGANVPVFGSGTISDGLLVQGTLFPPYINDSTNIWVKNCQCNQNSATDQALGLTIQSSNLTKNILIENTVFNSNFNTGPLTVGVSEGLVISRIDNFIVRDCSASDNKAIGGSGGVQSALNTNGLIENCQCYDNVGTTFSYGFFLFGSFFASPNSIVVRNCQTALSPANVSPGVQAVGFALQSGNGYVLDSCVAQGYQGGGASAGILPFSQQNLVLTNCTCLDNTTGIRFGNVLPQSINNIIQNNSCEGNIVAGFIDNVPGSNNAYFGNWARSNGPGGTVNYTGSSGIFPASTCPFPCAPVVGGTPIRQWVMPNLLCPVNTNCVEGDKLDNLDISP